MYPLSVRAFSCGVWIRDRVAVWILSAMALASAPCPASMRSSIVAPSRPKVHSHASGLAVRALSVDAFHCGLRTSLREVPWTQLATLYGPDAVGLVSDAC